MKQLTKYLTALCLAFTLVSIVGCASSSKHQATGEYFDDSVVTTKVKAAIFDEPSLKSFEINVVTFKGIVQLSGFVNSKDNIDKAIEISHKVNGVKSVENSMSLK